MMRSAMISDNQLKESSDSATLKGGPVATLETAHPIKAVNRPGLMTSILFIILLGSALLYIAAIRTETFGAYHDDGIYVTTAKALATGEGYRIISLPYEPAQTKYPPLYPFLLSLIWRVYPHFPENLTWMMMLSVAATLSFLGLTYRYLVEHGYAGPLQALIIVALAAINWRTVTLATGIYSEMFYAAFSVAALYLAEKYAKRQMSWMSGLVVGVIIGLAFLTRSSALALLVAVGLYYALRREWRKFLLVAGVSTMVVVGWAVWCNWNMTTVERVNVAYYTNYLSYFNEVVGDLQTMKHASRLETLLRMVGGNALMLILISIPVVCLSISYEWVLFFAFTVLFFAAGLLRSMSKGVRLLPVYVISYVALHLLWLPYVAYDRFLIPLLPFLLLFLLSELAAMASPVRKELKSDGGILKRLSAAFIALAMLVSVGVVIYNYGSNLRAALTSSYSRKAPGAPAENREAIEWINRHTDPSDKLVCYYDPLYFLHTGRKATRSFAMKAGVTWQAHQELIFNIIDENQARYLVCTSSDFENEYQPDLRRESFRLLITQHSKRFVPVFESADERSIIYRIDHSD